jgi:hypothetical protein
MDVNQQLQQLRDDALTYLVLWAASKEYSPVSYGAACQGLGVVLIKAAYCSTTFNFIW